MFHECDVLVLFSNDTLRGKKNKTRITNYELAIGEAKYNSSNNLIVDNDPYYTVIFWTNTFICNNRHNKDLKRRILIIYTLCTDSG